MKEERDRIIQEAMEWAGKEAQLINEKFQNPDKSMDVIFTDFKNYEIGKKIPISKGIDIVMLEYNEDYLIIKCWMDGMLSSHFHSTHFEKFYCIKGEMRDNLNTNFILTEGDSFTFLPNKKHEPIGKCELLIIGFRKLAISAQ